MSTREEIDRSVEASMAYVQAPGNYENYVSLCKRDRLIPLTIEELRKAAYKNFGIDLREPPKVCPICNGTVKHYETDRVLCESHSCDFEWYHTPFVKLPNELPKANIERLKRPELTNTERLCYLLGWQGGTVHQVARHLRVSVESILKAKNSIGLLEAVASL